MAPFVYQGMGLPNIGPHDVRAFRYFFDPGVSKFDISMEVFEHGDLVTCYWEYATKLFRRDTVVRMGRHFQNITQHVAGAPAVRIKDIPLLSREEYKEYIDLYNATHNPELEGTTIQALFEAQVERSPRKVAISSKTREVTFQELNNRANHLSILLRDMGVSPDGIVVILLPRSTELVISMIGVLKAGGCFLPLDIELPDERIRFILADSKCEVIICGTLLYEKITAIAEGKLQRRPFILNIDKFCFESEAFSNVRNVNSPADLAYIIYTSGTTGDPKGVMIEHRSFANYVCWAASYYMHGRKGTFPF